MSVKIDKRQLFFDRNRKNYIEFDLEKTKNCAEIYDSLHDEINIIINKLYIQKKDKNKNIKCKFIMMYSRSANKIDNSGLIEIKLDLDTSLSDIMVNKQYFLCYLPENNYDINKKKKTRNQLEEMNTNERFKDVERYTTKNQVIEKYLTNEGVYYFDKEKVEFIYGKGNVDENKLTIKYKTTNIEILIKDLKKEECFENTIPPSIQVCKIKCPNYILQIHQNNITHFLGLYRQKSYLIWKNAINWAKIKNNNTTIDSSFNTNLFNYNYLLFVKKHSIPSKCFIVNQLLENAEKRQIFLEEYQEKTISDITKSIYSYKINIKNNKYLEAWKCLKQICFYVDFDNIKDENQRKREQEKYSKIFSPERILLYNNVINKVNEAMKTIKINDEEEINKVLKCVFEIDLFDNLYYNIYELYIWPYFQTIKNMLTTEFDYDKKPQIIQKYHLLLSRYCSSFLNMKNIDTFNCLCSDEKNNDEDISKTNINNNIISTNESPSNDKDNNKVKDIDNTINNNKKIDMDDGKNSENLINSQT